MTNVTRNPQMNAEQTKQQVYQTIRQLKELARSPVSFEEFCQTLLTKIVPITGAYGAIIWRARDVTAVEPFRGLGPRVKSPELHGPTHHEWLLEVVRSQQAVCRISDSFVDGNASANLSTNTDAEADPNHGPAIDQSSREDLNTDSVTYEPLDRDADLDTRASAETTASVDGAEANDETDAQIEADDKEVDLENSSAAMLLMAVPIFDRMQNIWGVLELLQRHPLNAAAEQGYLKFLAQVADLFQRWQSFQHQRQAVTENSSVQQVSQPVNVAVQPLSPSLPTKPVSESGSAGASQRLEFVKEIHRSIFQDETCYAIANETRRLLNVDRVSVASIQGKRSKIAAISSQDKFDNRANVVRKLNKVAQLVAAARNPIWITGDTSGLAPKLAAAVNDYLDESHSRTLGVFPIIDTAPKAGDGDLVRRQVATREKCLGVVVIEHFANEISQDSISDALQLVTEQSASALGNARRTGDVMFLPLWMQLSRAKNFLLGEHLNKTLLATAVVVGITLALCFWPAALRVKVNGVLQPAKRVNVFSQLDGVVDRVFLTEDRQVVQAEQVLVELDSKPLKLKHKELEGQLRTIGEQLQSLERQQVQMTRLTPEDSMKLAGQIEQLRIQRTGLQGQLELVAQQMAVLQIKSPIDGTVITWDARRRLERLPVQANQPLVSVADLTGKWQLELMIPQGRVGYIGQALEESPQGVPTRFMLATDPNHTYEGQLVKIADRGEMNPQGDVEFRAIVEIDAEALPVLQPGAGVAVRVDCGPRPLGMVWFYQLIDYVRTRVLF